MGQYPKSDCADARNQNTISNQIYFGAVFPSEMVLIALRCNGLCLCFFEQEISVEDHIRTQRLTAMRAEGIITVDVLVTLGTIHRSTSLQILVYRLTVVTIILYIFLKCNHFEVKNFSGARFFALRR